ncbi:hypothetical protein B566_EDAN016787 [Ephemera danica]|nr:hypothetical protein B566_EDAN016787 [Ephemera danica]
MIFQVLALEAENFRLDNDTEATNRRLFGFKPTVNRYFITLVSFIYILAQKKKILGQPNDAANKMDQIYK